MRFIFFASPTTQKPPSSRIESGGFISNRPPQIGRNSGKNVAVFARRIKVKKRAIADSCILADESNSSFAPVSAQGEF
jgi:hypothetical protein